MKVLQIFNYNVIHHELCPMLYNVIYISKYVADDLNDLYECFYINLEYHNLKLFMTIKCRFAYLENKVANAWHWIV